MIHQKTKKIAMSGLLATFSLLLSFIGNSLVIPTFFWYKLDLSDFPVFTSTLLFGPSYGYVSLIAVNFIKTFYFSPSGWPGFFMRITSVISIFFLGLYFRSKKKLLFYSVLSVIVSILIKIPMSCLFWVVFKSMPTYKLFPLVVSVLFPYNLIKSIINIVLSIYLYKKLREFIND